MVSTSRIDRALRALGNTLILAAAAFSIAACAPKGPSRPPCPAGQVCIQAGNVSEPVESRYAIVNAFGFGGQNVVAVFGKVTD